MDAAVLRAPSPPNSVTGSNSRSHSHMWIEFETRSRPYSERFSFSSTFSFSSNIFKFQFVHCPQLAHWVKNTLTLKSNYFRYFQTFARLLLPVLSLFLRAQIQENLPKRYAFHKLQLSIILVSSQPSLTTQAHRARNFKSVQLHITWNTLRVMPLA